jgi:hypothetical protein
MRERSMMGFQEQASVHVRFAPTVSLSKAYEAGKHGRRYVCRRIAPLLNDQRVRSNTVKCIGFPGEHASDHRRCVPDSLGKPYIEPWVLLEPQVVLIYWLLAGGFGFLKLTCHIESLGGGRIWRRKLSSR